ALVPGSMLLLTGATMLAKNVIGELFSLPERAVTQLARGLVPALALLAVFFTLRGGETLVPLLLAGYNVVTQFMPAIVLALPERPRVSKWAALAGILAGEGTVAWITLSGTTLAKAFPAWPPVVTDLNVGIVALIVNVVVMLLVAALFPARRAAGGGATPP